MSSRGVKSFAWALACLAGYQAMPAHANTCAPATGQGTAPNDYQDYCWLDFTVLRCASAGRRPTLQLPFADGSTLTLTLQVSTNKTNPALAVHAVPSWTGSAIGHSAFLGIPGNPVLYETVSGSTVQVTLNNITVAPPAGSGSTASYAIIAADRRIPPIRTSLSRFTTNGQPWSQVAKIPYGPKFPAVTGLGTPTVTETGVSGTVGSFAFASFNNPTQISATLVVGGFLQESDVCNPLRVAGGNHSIERRARQCRAISLSIEFPRSAA